MVTVLSEIALALYIVGLILAIRTVYNDEPRQAGEWCNWILIIGLAVHSFAITYRYILTGNIPITSMHESSSFFAWSVMVIYFYIYYRFRFLVLGLFILPMVSILMLSSLILPSEIRPISPILRSYWLAFHTLFAFIGYASFTVAAGTGLMYLIQERHLKSKRPSWICTKLPSVQILDEINYKLIALGFPLHTLAIITGALWAEASLGSYWRWDPKEVWSLITWLIYALILHLRIVRGYRGRKAATLSIVGFLAVLFTYYGVNLLLKSYHLFQ
jgi:cytochrome c-type biogenesis protein CcsB